GGAALSRTLEILKMQLKNKPNLKVRILALPDFLQRKDRLQLKKMKNEFGKRFNYLITSPKTRFDQSFKYCENHVKLVIVDEKYFVTGGSSITDRLASKGDQTPHRNVKNDTFFERCLAGGYRDHDIVGKGPLAKVMREGFFKLYASWQ